MIPTRAERCLKAADKEEGRTRSPALSVVVVPRRAPARGGRKRVYLTNFSQLTKRSRFRSGAPAFWTVSTPPPQST